MTAKKTAAAPVKDGPRANSDITAYRVQVIDADRQTGHAAQFVSTDFQHRLVTATRDRPQQGVGEFRDWGQ